MSSEIREGLKELKFHIKHSDNIISIDAGMQLTDDDVAKIFTYLKNQIEQMENPYDKISHTPQEKLNWIIHNNAIQGILSKLSEGES